MFALCVMSHIELLRICIAILLSLPYQILLSNIEVVLPKFARIGIFCCLDLCRKKSVSSFRTGTKPK
jgi:hypothetical protein